MRVVVWSLVVALGGAVHDCIILFCSTRRAGRSLGQVVREEVGPFAGLLALIRLLTNNYINAAVTGTFLVLVVRVVLACARVEVQLLRGRRVADLREEPYVPLAEAAAAK